MSDRAKVREIIEAVAMEGVSAKTGKPWSKAKVELDNGVQTFMFNPIRVGEEVESFQNGDYKNWRLVKSDPKHDEIMLALRKIYGAITGVETPPSGLEKARAESNKIKERVEAKQVDEVADVEDTDEEREQLLKDIPF